MSAEPALSTPTGGEYDDLLALIDEEVEGDKSLFTVPTPEQLPDYWFASQKDAYIWALERFIKAERAYQEALRKYKDPRLAWMKGPLQRELIEAHAWRGLIFGQATGAGKALAVTTPIATMQGWTTMGEITPGAVIFDDQGQPTTVLSVSPVMVDHDVFDVVFDDGSVIRADADHLWQTSTRACRANASKVKSGANKTTRLRPSLVTTRQIKETLMDGPSTNHAVAVAKYLNLPEKDLPIDPYLLGCWLGDGSSYNGIITTNDEEIAEEFAVAGYQPHKRKEPFNDSTRGLEPQLRALSLAKARHPGQVPGEKHIPLTYLRAGVGQRQALLQGLVDTDGTVSARSGRTEVSLSKERLARGVYELACSLGLKPTLRVGRAALYDKDCGLRYRVAFTTSLPVARLERKRALLPDDERGTQDERMIVDVVPVASEPVRCILVDAPSHLFLAGTSMIPTHNTIPAMALAITRGLMTNRPVLWITRKPIAATTVYELLSNLDRDPLLSRIHWKQIIPLMGTPEQKELAVDRALALSGSSFTLLIGNPEAMLPAHAGEKALLRTYRPDNAEIAAGLPGVADELADDALAMADPATQNRVYAKLLKLPLAMVICDEFHDYIRNNKTNAYKLLFARLEPDWRLGLSATSFPYKPRQYAMAVSFFQPGLHFRSIASFVRENFIMEGDRVKEVLPSWQRKWPILRDKTIYSIQLDEVVELPPTEVIREVVTLSPSQQKAYRMAADRMILELEKGASKLRKEGASEREVARLDMENVLVQILRLKQICVDLRVPQAAVLGRLIEEGSFLEGISFEREPGETSPKIDRLFKIFFHEMDEFERAVAYSQWKSTIGFLMDDALREGIVADSITGDVRSDIKLVDGKVYSDRLAKCERLNYGNVELLGFNDSAAEGINLQRANRIFFLDWPWPWAKVAQALGRIRRPIPPDMLEMMGGTPLPVHVHMLVAKGTIEETMLLRLFRAAKAAGMWTKGVDIESDDSTEGRMFSEGDDIGSTVMTRKALIAALE